MSNSIPYLNEMVDVYLIGAICWMIVFCFGLMYHEKGRKMVNDFGLFQSLSGLSVFCVLWPISIPYCVMKSREQ